jgi:hypothetical protein
MNDPERGRERGVHQADWASVPNVCAPYRRAAAASKYVVVIDDERGAAIGKSRCCTRAELTVQERADHITEWLKLTDEKRQSSQVATNEDQRPMAAIWRGPDESYEVSWSPDQPRIRKPRPKGKFLAAYHAARREFFEEVAAVVGGGVLILDTDLKKICGHEIIVPPTQHQLFFEGIFHVGL